MGPESRLNSDGPPMLRLGGADAPPWRGLTAESLSERAGLISRGRDAQRRPRRLEVKPLAEATEWLESYRRLWEGNFQRLDALLDEIKSDEKKRGRAQ